MDRPMPKDTNLEAGLIGALLDFDQSDYDQVYQYVLEMDTGVFCMDQNRKLVEYIRTKVLQDRVVPDSILISSKFPKVDMGSYLENAELRFNIEASILELKTLALKRTMILMAKKLETTAFDPRVDSIPDLLGTVNKEAEKAHSAYQVIKQTDTRKTLHKACERIHESNEDQDLYRVRYCHPDVDNSMTIFRQQIHSLGAFQAHGKTALALDCLRYQILGGLRIVYFCTESPADEIMLRLMGNDMELSVQSMMSGMMQNERHVNRLKQTIESINQIADNFYIYGCDDFPLRIDDVASICSRLSRESGQLDMIYVDHLHDLEGPVHGKNMDERQQIGYNAKRFKQICVDLNCAGTMLCQFNQEAHREAQPTKRSFRGTGVISDISHVMSVLFREDGKDSKPNQKTKWYSVKTRLIKPWMKYLTFDGSTGRFSQHHNSDHRYGVDDLPEPIAG